MAVGRRATTVQRHDPGGARARLEKQRGMRDSVALLMKRQVITLGMANMAEFAAGLLTPIVLVRVLDEIDFGSYRLVWLVAATLLAIVPLSMPSSLLYFLPRHDLRGQAVFVRQTLFYMAAAAALSALALSPWNPLLPDSLRTMAGADFAAPLFCALWAFGSVLDVLLN